VRTEFSRNFHPTPTFGLTTRFTEAPLQLTDLDLRVGNGLVPSVRLEVADHIIEAGLGRTVGLQGDLEAVVIVIVIVTDHAIDLDLEVRSVIILVGQVRATLEDMLNRTLDLAAARPALTPAGVGIKREGLDLKTAL
jgi:hypothetical protein